MHSLKKSEQAKEDLIYLWLYGLEHYGESNADFYFDELETKIDSLLDYPEKYRLQNYYSPPVRICPHRSHLIIYTIENDELFIVRAINQEINIKDYI
jgi:toxin ParE1/3/4